MDEIGFMLSHLQVIPVMYRWELIPGAGTLAGNAVLICTAS